MSRRSKSCVDRVTNELLMYSPRKVSSISPTILAALACIRPRLGLPLKDLSDECNFLEKFQLNAVFCCKFLATKLRSPRIFPRNRPRPGRVHDSHFQSSCGLLPKNDLLNIWRKTFQFHFVWQKLFILFCLFPSSLLNGLFNCCRIISWLQLYQWASFIECHFMLH